MQNNGPESASLNLFIKDTTCLFTSLKLLKYVLYSYKNWDNYEPDDKTIVKVKENNNENIDGKSPNNLYKLYSV